jgi:hypothetical protein
MIESASHRLAFGRLTSGKPGRDAVEHNATVLISSRACRASRVFDVGVLGNLRYDWYTEWIAKFHPFVDELHLEISMRENVPIIQIVPFSASPHGYDQLGTRLHIEMLDDEYPSAINNLRPRIFFSARQQKGIP